MYVISIRYSGCIVQMLRLEISNLKVSTDLDAKTKKLVKTKKQRNRLCEELDDARDEIDELQENNERFNQNVRD